MSEILRDSYLEFHNYPEHDRLTTFHNFLGVKERHENGIDQGRIDYFWINDQVDIKQVKIVYDNPSTIEGVYPSDHYPLFGKFEI